ncbi:MAG: ATP-binding cassette domain-containing protein [Planctomycetes bacterium]|nr:ATP-binding cassette domain-containing protein [Planctomycetota bacterium]
MAEVVWDIAGVGRYSGMTKRLSDITLKIESGTTAVVGYSGAGKTTLLNILAGFESPDTGVVRRTIPKDDRPELFWVPQDGGLWPHLSVRRHLETTASPAWGDAGLTGLLAEFDLDHKADDLPDDLSVGEKARLSVARALVTDAHVLVMDEPLSSVDPARAPAYWKVIRRCVAETGASLVFATHSPKTVLREAASAICLKAGRLLYAGGVDELYRQPRTPELAECLGEANWFTPTEAARWLGMKEPAPKCLRPEQLSVEPDDAGEYLVEESSFQGAVASVLLKDPRDGGTKNIWHRPAGDLLCRGMRATLKVFSMLVIALLFGCWGPPPEWELGVREVNYWNMPPEGPKIPAPRDVAMGAGGEAYVLDTAGRVLVFDTSGRLAGKWWMPEYDVGKAEGVCVLKNGNIAVADTHYSRVIVFDAGGTELFRFGGFGRDDGRFVYPVAVAEDDEGFIYVCEYGGNDRVQKFTPDGKFAGRYGAFGSGPTNFQRPSGIAWLNGEIVIADAMNNRLVGWSPAAGTERIIGRPGADQRLDLPYDVACDGAGFMYVVEYSGAHVTRLAPDGSVAGRWGSVGRGPGQLNTPWGIDVDRTGRILVTDTGNRRIVEILQ